MLEYTDAEIHEDTLVVRVLQLSLFPLCSRAATKQEKEALRIRVGRYPVLLDH